MKATLIAFNKSIEELERQIQSLDLQWRIFKSQPNSSIGSDLATLSSLIGSGIFRRQFEYNSIVVTLYGLFEQYIEGLVVAFLRRLNQLVPQYSALPQIVQSSHMEMTIALLSKPDLQKYRDTCKPLNLVENLNSCLNGGPIYQLNAEAFTYHTANFKSEVIDKTFSRIGITNLSQRIKAIPSFAKFLGDKYTERLQSRPEVDVFRELNDLAERRNEVAHGSASEILSNAMSLDYLLFVKEYASALAQVAVSETLAHEVKYLGRNVGKPIVVYNNNIVCLRLEHAAVSVGDRILAETTQSNLPFLEGEIREIQVNRVSHLQLNCQHPIDVALRVEFRAKNSFTYYLMEPAVTPWSVDSVAN